MDSVSQNVSLLLQNLNCRDSAAESKLISVIYDELRRLAAYYMHRERPTMFAVAAKLIRQILMDHARGRLRDKRGAGGRKLSLDEGLLLTEARSAELLALDSAVDRLAKLDPRQARIVELSLLWGPRC